MRQQIKRMRMLSTAIAITYFTLSLTGCTPPAADTAPSKGEQPATGSADTAPIDVRVPATFNPKDPNFKLFDPCTELDDEVFKKAGLGGKTQLGNRPTGDYFTCSFSKLDDSDYFGVVSIATNKVNQQIVEQKTMLISSDVESQIPNVYQYRLSADSDNECASVAQTSGGQLDVSLMTVDPKMSAEQICDESLSFLEILYPEVEKRIKNGIR